MLYDAEGDYWYSPYRPLQWDPVMPMFASEPHNSDFDVNKLPWSEMPTYIKDILYGSYVGNVTDSAYSGEVKLPFVVVVVRLNQVHVFVGQNLCIGTVYSDASTVSAVYILARKESAQIFNNSVCYHAYFNASDYSLTQDWAAVEAVDYGDRYVRYNYFPYPESVARDYYLYGFNTVKPGAALFTQSVNSGSTYPMIKVVNDCKTGFQSGKIFIKPDLWSLSYSASFSPPTAEQQQAQTSRGIWDTLKDVLDYVKNLPKNIANSIKGFFDSLGDRISGFFTTLSNNIKGFFTSLGDRISGFFDALADKIKGFFLPSEGFFDTYVSSFQEYFQDRFGLLYEIPDAVIGIFQQFIDYSPAESGYSITFPEVVMPVLEDGEWYDKVIIEETDIRFEFLEQGAFKTLYSMYRSVVWMIFIFALINLIIRESERVFGGSG